MKKWIAVAMAAIMILSLAACSTGSGESSTVAKYWRIRTGINQSDCALSTEMDLALALENYDGVSGVDFETVWGQGHCSKKGSKAGQAKEIGTDVTEAQSRHKLIRV